MANIQIIDLLEADPRPTFLIDLTTCNPRSGICDISYYNPALLALAGVKDTIEQGDEDGQSFREWAASADVLDNTQTYGEIVWTSYTVKSRWRFISVAHTPYNRRISASHGRGNHALSVEEEDWLLLGNSKKYDAETAQHLEYIRRVDWEGTELGPLSSWPTEVQQVINCMMADMRPTAIYLGPDNTMLYNVAYATVAGQKHPAVLGRPLQDVWPEAWPIVADAMQQSISHSRIRVGMEDMQLFINRRGFLEETYFRFSVAPLRGSIHGFYNPVWEISQTRIAERRTAALLSLSQGCSAARDSRALGNSIITGLTPYEYDFPLVALYSVGEKCILESSLGVPQQSNLPQEWDLADSGDEFAACVRRATESVDPVVLGVEDGSLPKFLQITAEGRGFPDTLKTAVIFPMRPANRKSIMGFVLIGLNTRQRYSDEHTDYKDWILLLAKLLTSFATSVAYFEDEADLAARDQALLTDQLAVRTQEAAQASERLQGFQTTAEMVTVGIFEFNPDGTLVRANDAWYKLSGYPVDPNKAKAFSFMSLVYEEDTQLVVNKWTELVNGNPISFEMRWKSQIPGGEPLWVLAACVPLFAEDGMVTTLHCCNTDITAQKRTEQAALQRAAALEQAKYNEQRFLRFTELADVGVFILDKDRKMQFCNDKWFNMVRLPRMDFVQIDWKDVVHEDDMPIVMESFITMNNTKEPAYFQFRVKRRHSSDEGTRDLWTKASCCPLMSEDGAILNFMGTIIDISSFKWAEAEQKLRADEALRAKHEQENFIDTVSHEMRNPLSAMLQCADLIQSSLTSASETIGAQLRILESRELKEQVENSLDAVQTIIACAMHQKRIVDDVLTLSKLDSKLLTVSLIQVDPVQMVQTALKMFDAETHKAQIQVDFVPDKSLQELHVNYALLDPSRLLQILINLVTNSIKFTQDRKERNITVTLGASVERPSEWMNLVDFVPVKSIPADLFISADDGKDIYLYFSVQDTGCGLTLEEKGRLFKKFTQASPKTHVVYGGSGLGLFISRELAEVQGGEIGVRSEADVGSTFVFFVKTRVVAPASPNPTKNRNVGQAPKAAPAKFDLAGYSLLLVEDNVVNQKVLRKQLQKLGCTVHVAGHGGEALDFIRKSNCWRGQEASGQSLSLILMDVEMPVMGGLTATKHIREYQRTGDILYHIPIIAISANARGEQIAEMREAGVDDALSKPFRIAELVPKIGVYIDWRKK